MASSYERQAARDRRWMADAERAQRRREDPSLEPDGGNLYRPRPRKPEANERNFMTPSDIRSAAARSYSNPDKTDDMLRRTLCDAADEIERLREERGALVADKNRLDFLQAHACEEGRTVAMPRYSYRVKQWQGDPGPNIRSAIDIEMREHANAHAESQAPNYP